MSPQHLGFGIEIEAVVQPRKIRPSWIAAQYYERLAQALRNRDLPAKSDPCTERYRKHPEHYNKWFITKDGSLNASGGCLSLEAVSPKMKSRDDNWEDQIKLFWEAMTIVFKVQQDTSCGSHIHVAPIGRKYKLDEVKMIAFAICLYEPYIFSVLPRERRNNPHCERNSKVVRRMGALLHERSSAALKIIANDIKRQTDYAGVCNYMQNSANNSDRKVLWNFQNLVASASPGHQPSGTIEFRGGRHLRGAVRTLRWITFAVVFISMAVDENRLNSSEQYPVPSNAKATEVAVFWAKLRCYAEKLELEENIPIDFRMMNETMASA